MGIYSSKFQSYNNGSLIDLETVEESKHPISIAGGIACVVENEQNYNKLMQAIAIAELCHLESTGEEMVYTEGVVSDFFKKVKEMFKKILAKIAGLFKKFIAMIDGFFKNDKDFLTKYEKDLNDANPKNLTYKGYKFDIDAWTPATDSKSVSDIKAIFAKAVKDDGNHDTKEIEKFEDNDTREDMLEVLRGEVLGTNKKVSSDDLSTEIFKLFRNGETDKEEMDVTTGVITKCTAHLRKSDELKRTAKKNYTELEKKINEVIKTLESQEKDLRNNEMSEKNSLALRVAKLYTRYAQDLLNVNSVVYSGQLQAIKDYSRQCKAICVRVLTHKESASYGINHYTESFLGNVEFN